MGTITTFSGEKVFESKKLVSNYLIEDEFWEDLKSQMLLTWEKCLEDEEGNLLFIGAEKSTLPEKFEEGFEKLADNKDLVQLIHRVEEEKK